VKTEFNKTVTLKKHTRILPDVKETKEDTAVMWTKKIKLTSEL
jgi:hypothetical protein